MSDLQSLIFRTPHKVNNVNDFRQHSLRLCYHKEKVAELNMSKLKSLNQPIAMHVTLLVHKLLVLMTWGASSLLFTCQKVQKSC